MPTLTDNNMSPRQVAVAAEPSGYDPTAIEQRIQQKLNVSSYFAIRNVSCSFHEGVATLRGQVSSFYFKQTAQEIVRKIDGVDQIVNRISVV
jgi:osmotically-inducible protein OsmY